MFDATYHGKEAQEQLALPNHSILEYNIGAHGTSKLMSSLLKSRCSNAMHPNMVLSIQVGCTTLYTDVLQCLRSSKTIQDFHHLRFSKSLSRQDSMDVAILLGIPCVGVPIIGQTCTPWQKMCLGAYILKLIGGYLMPDKSSKEVYLMYLPLLGRLDSRKTSVDWFHEHQYYNQVWNDWAARIALAPAYHGRLHRTSDYMKCESWGDIHEVSEVINRHASMDNFIACLFLNILQEIKQLL
ncbi:serine/threonine-protein phosphatase 7 long form-like protein [Senna tora]|uniref:Serine/threonine-protein phosphatase 7 long form-like protein n=1 Tax=Senna tora TaxID=362788 RepID=A0A834SSW0_9FABA|nr:serine/threonine-protein phosphatase 7 long form-like protein [Senna tora]